MKMMKKLLAMLLATAMILTGLYIVPGKATEVKATESGSETENTTVNTDMLNVKFQAAQTPITDESDANNGKYVMRFIASVDSLDYSAVGFEVTSSEGNARYNTQTVFERIQSEDVNVSYEFSPKVVDTSSEYFVTARMYATPSVNYTIRAYVVSLDGTTTTYGGYRCVSAEDGLAGVTTTNVSFEETTADTYKVGIQYDITSSDEGTQATVFAKSGTTVHARVNVAPSALPSATKFTFGSGETVIYRNLYTTHVPAEGTTPVADKSWYEVYGSSEEAYVIATGADLYGLAAIVDAGTQLFDDKTIYVVSDIALNSTGNKTYAWNPIGSDTISFNGSFDGQMHQISGIHVNVEKFAGLFAWTGAGTIANVRLADSTFAGTGTGTEVYVGSLAGLLMGNANAIYAGTDVTVTSTGQETGGVIGRVSNGRDHTITNCQFDGAVTGNNDYIGGIVGRIALGHTTMSNCLNKGSVSSTEISVTNDNQARCGGLIGGVQAWGELSVSLELSESLNTGSVTSQEGVIGAVGAIIGRTRGTTTLMNVYFEAGKVACGTGTPNQSDTVAGCGNYSTNDNNTVNGIAKERTSVDLKGALARYNTGFDYYTGSEDDGVWVAQDGDYPVLKAFADSKTYYTEDVTMTADTSWYDADDVKTTYYISTAAELGGLAELSKDSTCNWFSGTTFKITADITLNLGDASDWSPSVKPLNSWNPIGVAQRFNGIFDGQGHTISGLYLNATTEMSGMFGHAGADSQVKNFSLVNSYLTSTQKYLGGIAGFANGNLENIYCSAVLNSSNQECGGIVGRFGSTSTATISKCQFDGTVTSSARYCGGIVGYIDMGIKTLSKCLNTGTVSSTLSPTTDATPYAGGLFGGCISSGPTITLQDCLQAGEVSSLSQYATGSVTGRVREAASFTLTNVYTTNNCYYTDASGVKKTPDITWTGYIGIGNASSVQPVNAPILTTEEEAEALIQNWFE